MGSLGLSMREAMRFPHTMFWPSFYAQERRHSRFSVHLMDDLIAIGGLQGEMQEQGAKKSTQPRTKTIPVGYMRHLEKRIKEGWPSKRIWTVELERRAQEKFWGGLGDIPVLDLTKNKDNEPGEDEDA